MNGFVLFLMNFWIHWTIICFSVQNTLLDLCSCFFVKSEIVIVLILYSSDLEIRYCLLSWVMLKLDSFICETINVIWLEVSLSLGFLWMKVCFISSICFKSDHWLSNCLSNSSSNLNGLISELFSISSSWFINSNIFSCWQFVCQLFYIKDASIAVKLNFFRCIYVCHHNILRFIPTFI